MTVPTIHATRDDLRSELWWDQNICPVARAHGIDPDSRNFGLQIDPGDPACQYLRHPDGTVVLVVRVTGRNGDGDSRSLATPQTADVGSLVTTDTPGPSTPAQEAL